MEIIPATDNHIHVDAINGEGPLEVALKFQRSGGTTMIIPNKPTWTLGNNISFREAMETVVKYVGQINNETTVKAFAVVGVHPAELSRLLRDGKTFREGEHLMREALKTAQELVIEGHAVAIGEIGRPHYPVDEKELEIHNNLILYAMELAQEAECPVQLHTESAGPDEFLEFAKIADQARLKHNKVIKHFSGPMVLPEENYGLTPSLISSGEVIRAALKKGKNFLMETDYLDDSSRPGAVLGPKTVPRRTRKLLNSEMITLDDVYNIHVDQVEKLYGVQLNL